MFIFILSLLAAPFLILSIIIAGIIVIFFSFLNIKKSVIDFIIGTWADFSLFIYRVKVDPIKGLENIPSGACLFLFNHSSHFDILVLQSVVPRIRFGAKIELFSFPIFGTAMRRAGVLPIARNNIEEVKKIYSSAESRTAKGECFALAPEGTRQNTDKVLGTFKSGPFIFAMNSGIPIVPVIIQGCHDVLPKNKILPSTQDWFKTVSITFGPIINVDQEQKKIGEIKNILQQKTRDWMLEEINKNN